jgi:hypothetical protein
VSGWTKEWPTEPGWYWFTGVGNFTSTRDRGFSVREGRARSVAPDYDSRNAQSPVSREGAVSRRAVLV